LDQIGLTIKIEQKNYKDFKEKLSRGWERMICIS